MKHDKPMLSTTDGIRLFTGLMGVAAGMEAL